MKLQFSARLLRSCSLLQQENPFPKASSGIVSLCRRKTYVEVWRQLLEESYFNILLRDYSIFILKLGVRGAYDQNNISLSYFGCPFDFVSIEDYIIEEYGEEYLEYQYDAGFQKEYEQVLNDSPPVESPVMFRYDYSPNLYLPARHPASHLHVGFQNEIRMGCKRILDPLSFISFVLRQQYPEIWASEVVAKYQSVFKSSIRDSLPVVPKACFCKSDKLEMYLN